MIWQVRLFTTAVNCWWATCITITIYFFVQIGNRLFATSFVGWRWGLIVGGGWLACVTAINLVQGLIEEIEVRYHMSQLGIPRAEILAAKYELCIENRHIATCASRHEFYDLCRERLDGSFVRQTA